MNLKQKLKILGKAASHDTCDPGCKLLKVLMSNACVNNCQYCASRRENNIERATFKPEELARLFMQLVKKKWVYGIFLSSAVIGTTNYTMKQMIQCVYLIRSWGFGGYIHLKVLPGAGEDILEYASKLVDRMSVNLEAPAAKFLRQTCPDKNYYSDLLGPMKFNKTLNLREGQTTQMVVGATDERDQDILNVSDNLYSDMQLKRVYYSAFQPINQEGMGGILPPDRAKREWRLYQADALLRFYGFNKKDFVYNKNKNLYLSMDPKQAWAKENIKKPIEINKANKDLLMKIPGIGPKTADNILTFRKDKRITQDYELKKLKLNIPKAKEYILLQGKMLPQQLHMFD